MEQKNEKENRKPKPMRTPHPKEMAKTETQRLIKQ
jgi:hypothetical protein